MSCCGFPDNEEDLLVLSGEQSSLTFLVSVEEVTSVGSTGVVVCLIFLFLDDWEGVLVEERASASSSLLTVAPAGDWTENGQGH